MRINTIVAIFQSSSGYRPELGQIIDVWAKLLGRLTSSLQRLRRRRGGRGNKHTIGHLTRATSDLLSPVLHPEKYKPATSQQHQLYGPSQTVIHYVICVKIGDG